jgi:putative transposase
MEVEALSREVSPSSNKPYGVARVARAWGLARSTFYASRHRRNHPRELRKCGPRRISDEALLEEIRRVIAETAFRGEGYRKIWARLRHRDVRVWKERVLWLMRENGLLSPHREAAVVLARRHDGVIVTSSPDQVWGADATAAKTEQDGQVTVFAAIDHCTAECVGIHVAKRAHRFEALEPIRQGVREHFGGFSGGISAALCLRHDHGSVYVSRDFQSEVRFLGIRSSPSFIRQPEGNGCIERFFRTLKEQLLWIERFRNIEELRKALHGFRERYNGQWIVQRLGYRTPSQARRDFMLALPSAA